MSNFNPSPDVLDKWTSTRKAKKNLGDSFSHPRLFSTVAYPKDKIMFGIALLIELTTLFVAIFFSGFNPFLIIGSAILVALDLWFGANRLHINEEHINKFHCKLEAAKYEERKKIKPESTSLTEQEGFKRSINTYEKRKIKFKIALFIIAAIKAFYGFLVLAPYGMTIAIAVPALFFIAAYIHIENTGYYFAESKRRSVYNKEESIYIADVALKQKSKFGIDNAVIRPLDYLDKLPEIKTILTQILNTLSTDEKKELRINLKNQRDESSKYITLYGQNTLHKVIYDENSENYFLYRWGNIKDDDLFTLIDESSMEPDLKSYIGYNGLRSQYYDTNIKDAKVPVN